MPRRIRWSPRKPVLVRRRSWAPWTAVLGTVYMYRDESFGRLASLRC